MTTNKMQTAVFTANEDIIVAGQQKAQKEFHRASLKSVMRNDDALANVDYNNFTTESLQELVNAKAASDMSGLPVLGAKLGLKFGLSFIKTKFPNIPLTPENITVTITNEERVAIMNSDPLFKKPSLMFVTMKTVFAQMAGPLLASELDKMKKKPIVPPPGGKTEFILGAFDEKSPTSLSSTKVKVGATEKPKLGGALANYEANSSKSNPNVQTRLFEFPKFNSETKKPTPAYPSNPTDLPPFARKQSVIESVSDAPLDLTYKSPTPAHSLQTINPLVEQFVDVTDVVVNEPLNLTKEKVLAETPVSPLSSNLSENEYSEQPFPGDTIVDCAIKTSVEEENLKQPKLDEPTLSGKWSGNLANVSLHHGVENKNSKQVELEPSTDVSMPSVEDEDPKFTEQLEFSEQSKQLELEPSPDVSMSSVDSGSVSEKDSFPSTVVEELVEQETLSEIPISNVFPHELSVEMTPVEEILSDDPVTSETVEEIGVKEFVVKEFPMKLDFSQPEKQPSSVAKKRKIKDRVEDPFGVVLSSTVQVKKPKLLELESLIELNSEKHFTVENHSQELLAKQVETQLWDVGRKKPIQSSNRNQVGRTSSPSSLFEPKLKRDLKRENLLFPN